MGFYVRKNKHTKPTHQMTMEVICLMLGLEPRQVSDPQDLSIKFLDFWPVALSLLADPKQLLSDLETYHKRHPEADVELMSQLTDEYLQDPDFAPKAMRLSCSTKPRRQCVTRKRRWQRQECCWTKQKI